MVNREPLRIDSSTLRMQHSGTEHASLFKGCGNPRNSRQHDRTGSSPKDSARKPKRTSPGFNRIAYRPAVGNAPCRADFQNARQQGSFRRRNSRGDLPVCALQRAFPRRRRRRSGKRRFQEQRDFRPGKPPNDRRFRRGPLRKRRRCADFPFRGKIRTDKKIRQG